jgi:23S rRNA (cytidine1920-2'-O)/16S rRNA (cytidine1409-2'-O)-methyltransferase
MSGPTKAPRKVRADQTLVERDLAESQTRAQALIMAGTVFSGTVRIDKPGTLIAANAPLELRGREHPWASRGGLKLAHALEHFEINPKGAICLDIGASTGGFTDVLLTCGAARVYAVDVGHGQFDWRLRQDDRVIVMEQTNARHISREEIPDAIGLIVCDASFIGLETVLPAALSLAADAAILVALIKPQFEVARGEVGKGGVVRNEALHLEVCQRISNWLDNLAGWQVQGIAESPITGPKGNKEFLIAAHRVGD